MHIFCCSYPPTDCLLCASAETFRPHSLLTVCPFCGRCGLLNPCSQVQPQHRPLHHPPRARRGRGHRGRRRGDLLEPASLRGIMGVRHPTPRVPERAVVPRGCRRADGGHGVGQPAHVPAACVRPDGQHRQGHLPA